MEKSKDLSILIYSCWKNSDMWDIFGLLFQKYWKDCNYKIVLLTDKYEKEIAKHIFDEIVALDGTWHEMLMAGMERANTEYVMLWMDDYLLCDYVNEKDIEKFLTAAREYNVANIRLIESSMIKSETFELDDNYNVYEPGTAYSLSTQVGIWNVKWLKEHINPAWTAWDFERRGSMEIKDSKHPLLAPKYYTFPYEEGVRRGKWLDSGIKVCKRNNINLDFTKRKPMSSFELAWTYLKAGIIEINPSLVLKIQNLLMK